MTYYQRLVATGMNPECAMDAVAWYTLQGDDDGLEKYVTDVERANRHVDRVQPESAGA